MNEALLLGKLPPFGNQRVIVERQQSVYDIMREVLTAHRIFASDYDAIANDFWAGDLYHTCKNLWEFLKRSVRYKVESEGSQTTKSPSALLTLGVGDCKHYSGFIGGVLDALKRQGKKINWYYRFASYNAFTRTPEHVFIVVNDGGKEIWIDPVLKSFNEKLRPAYYTDKKVNMLTRISGIGATKNFPASYLLEAVDYSVSPRLYNAIQLLLKYGIMNSAAQVNIAKINKFKKDPVLFASLNNAVADTKTAAIGGFFSDIWRGYKKVVLAPMRNAYLSLVGINAFGYATKLKKAIYNQDGTYTPYQLKIYDLWSKKFGGDWSALRNTINDGARKKAILGVAPAVPAWVATATAIIAAMTPIITAALKAKQQTIPNFNGDIDPATGLPFGSPQTSGGGPLDWIKENPLIVAGGIAAIYFLTQKKKTA